MSFEALSEYAIELSAEYPEDGPTEEDLAWEGSPFDWIRSQPSGTKGSIGRYLAQSLLEGRRFDVGRVGTRLSVDATQIRVKLSLEWGAGAFKFQQIRDEPFDYLFCLGLYPTGAYGWFIPREEFVVDGVWQERTGVTTQHGGMTGNDTKWLSVDPANPPTWLAPYGGSIPVLEGVITSSLT